MRIHNLFTNTEPPYEGECFDTLLRHKNLVVERIVSSSIITPREYVQPQDEWVLLVKGEAALRVADESLTLTPGDHLFLPAGVPHTVERTSHGAIWLAIHLYPEHLATPDMTSHVETPGAHRRR
ncbi:MAG: cupin [Candidatus Methylomirabilota bacterium]|nr:cupin domain-containing protein [Candidatus Methylomirabilis sp.]PWB46372.1 MAG: cupin [candidate division NC10 bacterium]